MEKVYGELTPPLPQTKAILCPFTLPMNLWAEFYSLYFFFSIWTSNYPDVPKQSVANASTCGIFVSMRDLKDPTKYFG